MQPVHHRSPGFRIFSVAMRTIPTQDHFDPEAMMMPIFGEGEYEKSVIWRRESALFQPVQVYPGPIWISDRVNKQFNFFSYGGVLQVVHEGPNCTIYVMSSAAPILSLGTQVTLELEDQLATESEALLARLRAAAHCRRTELAPRLAVHSPLARYAGVMKSILESYRHSPLLASAFPDFYKLVRDEMSWLATQPGVTPKPLEQMVDLAPAAARKV
jgi:hypothetical protein